MNYDVCIVGGGPAGLATAIHLKQLHADWSVCVIEKSAQIGGHALSGAVLEPEPLDILLPHWRNHQPNVCVPASKDRFYFFNGKRRWLLPTPPQMKNEGNFIVSLGSLLRFMAAEAENIGVDIFAGFSAREALVQDNEVKGIRCGDFGVNKDGSPSEQFAPGVDIHAKHTILAEGCRGSVSKQLIEQFKLDKKSQPQTYGLGFKELWRVPEGRVQPGRIEHSVGWPLDTKTYGGSFTYHLNDNLLYLGFVVGLDYHNPDFEPFEAFQQFKHHPKMHKLLQGGELLEAGARTLVEGGYQALPKLDMPGALLVGDAAGTLNVPKIKGIHMALHSGILAAQHLIKYKTCLGFDDTWRASPSAKELKKVRNIRPGFYNGLWLGLFNAAFETLFRGKSPWTHNTKADHTQLKRAGKPAKHMAERNLAPKDRLASVYFANTSHDENQPVHLQVADPDVCISQCKQEYNNPCTRFCPAQVYEMVNDEAGEHLHINAANCVHCKACDIKDPYQIINWVTPEGGSGPNYQKL